MVPISLTSCTLPIIFSVPRNRSAVLFFTIFSLYLSHIYIWTSLYLLKIFLCNTQSHWYINSIYPFIYDFRTPDITTVSSTFFLTHPFILPFTVNCFLGSTFSYALILPPKCLLNPLLSIIAWYVHIYKKEYYCF